MQVIDDGADKQDHAAQIPRKIVGDVKHVVDSFGKQEPPAQTPQEMVEDMKQIFKEEAEELRKDDGFEELKQILKQQLSQPSTRGDKQEVERKTNVRQRLSYVRRQIQSNRSLLETLASIILLIVCLYVTYIIGCWIETSEFMVTVSTSNRPVYSPRRRNSMLTSGRYNGTDFLFW